jgi:hypothetical protein
MSQSEIKTPFKITGGGAVANEFVTVITANGVASLAAITIGNLFGADGTTTTKFLSEAGTWLIPAGTASGVTSINNLNGTVIIESGTGITVSSTGSPPGSITITSTVSGFANPMTTLGDIIYENATPAAARLAGNVVAQKQYLSQAGTAAVPAYLITGQILGSPVNSFTGCVGCFFTASATPPTVGSLGRWVISGNSGTHTLYLCSIVASTLTVLGSVTVNTVGATPGTYLYGAITPVTLVSGTVYAVLSSETNAGDQYYNNLTTFVTPNTAYITGSLKSAYDTAVPPTYAGFNEGIIADISYGPVNFLASSSGTSAAPAWSQINFTDVSFGNNINAVNANNTKKFLAQIGPTGTIAFVQGQDTYFANPGGVSTESLLYNNTNALGNLLFAVFGWEDVAGLTITSVTDSLGNLWQSFPKMGVSGTHTGQAWYALNCNAGANTVTATWSGATATYVQISLAEYSGVDTLGPANAAATGNNGSPTSNNITTTAASSLLIGYGDEGGNTWTAGAGYTLRTTSAAQRSALEDQYPVAAGTYDATFSLLGGDPWECGIASFYHSAQLPVQTGWMSIQDIDVPNATILENGSTGTSTSPIVLQNSPTLATPIIGSNFVEYRHVLDLDVTASAKTGTLKLILPNANRTAQNFLWVRVTGYDFSTYGAWEAICGGQVHGGSGPWQNCTATILGTPPFTSVRFADDGTNACILLGTTTTTWEYPDFSVDVWVGNQAATGWNTGWTTAFVTSEAGYTIYATPTISTYIGNIAGNVTAAGNVTLATNGSAYIFTDKEAGNPYFSSQTDDNFVFYGTNAAGAARAIWGIAMHSSTSNLQINPPVLINADLVVGAATGGALGTGTINVSSGIYLNNAVYNNPDYVLEKYFTGEIVKFADNPGAKDYEFQSLSQIETYAKENLQLPRVGEKRELFSRTDVLLEKIEELYIHIFELRAKVKELESRLPKPSD